jgi:lipopolysaccharide export system ATP-binding protein
MLTIKNLNQKIKDRDILKSISMSAKPGIVTTLLGPNGAGKTTLLKSIIGLLPSEKNTISFNNHPISTWPTSKRVSQGIIYLPQQTSLFQQLSVIDNLALVYHYHPYWKQQEWGSFVERIHMWFSQTGITCPFDQRAGSLSGGQKRKLEVVRTILMKPKVAMFDEPFAGVDPKSIYELKEIFSNMADEQNIAVIISDHNVDQLLSISNYIYVIIDGQVVTHGGIRDILDDRKTKDAYFGNQFYTEISERFLN